MNLGEQTLLILLVAFVLGVAVGRLWSHLGESRTYRKRWSKHPSIHFILGLDWLASRQIDRAVAELTKAAHENEAPEIYLILGNLLREKGQLERAIQIHQSILHRPGLLQSERAHALLCLGVDFKRAGFRDRALDTFNEVVELEPDNAYAIENLMKIYEEDKDWSRALELQERLTRITGDQDDTLTAFLHDQIGQAAWAASEPEVASRAFETASRTQPRLPPPYLHYGDMLASQDRWEEAEKQWQTLASECPQYAYLVFDRLRGARLKLGREESMEGLYQAVIEREDKDWRAHVALAQLKLSLNHRDAAFELLLRAVSNHPHALAVHVEIWKLFSIKEFDPDRIQRYLDALAAATFFFDPYICIKCNYRTNGLLWRCPHCQDWNSFVEERLEGAEDA